MLRHVRPECSVFRVLSTPNAEVFSLEVILASLLPSEYIEDITWQRGDIRILSSSERYFQHEVLSQNACHKNVMKLGYKVIKEK